MISAFLAVIENESQRNELAVFYEANKSKLYKIAFQHLNNREESEEVVQEAFSDIADKPEIFFSKNENERLVYTAVIVKNLSINHFNYSRKHIAEELTDDVVDEKISVMEQALGECSKEDLMNYIKSLSEPLRQALLLRIHYQMNTSEIASALDISETAVRKRLSDAGKKIKKYLKGNNYV